MSKRLIKLCLMVMACTLLSMTTAMEAFAFSMPQYLNIKDFQKCLATKDMGSFESWCMPANKSEACPNESWEELNNLTGIEKVPSC